MIRSMTGFGKTSANYQNKKITVEVRSVNSKQLDLSIRIPNVYKEKEIEIKNLLAEQAERGKIDVTIYYENLNDDRNYTINKQIAINYYKELQEISKELNLKEENLLSVIMRMPEVVGSDKKELDENEWKVIYDTVKIAVVNFNSFRDSEGAKLLVELENRVNSIGSNLKLVDNYEKERIETTKTRIEKSLKELGQENIDRNRFEQELIYYLEKLDVTEEKQRLSAHCSYFLETLKKENNQGRKLGFITQEMGREINTLGSKSNHAEMQKLVVLMKDELEKIKEQVLNVL